MHNNRITTFLIITLLGLLLAPFAWAEDELLMPDQAFQISARSDDPDTLLVEWQIADGYYMYRDKLRFSSDAVGIELGEPEFSEAKIKQDEFFGEVAIYRGHASARIPIKRDPGAPETITLEARSQGCADLGICFPPHSQEIKLALALAPQPAAAQQASPAPLPLLGETAATAPLFANDEGGELLPPEEAYKLAAIVEDGRRLRLRWEIAPGTYLYHDKIKLALIEADGVALGDYQLPEPDIKKDSPTPDGTIGDVAVYHDQIELLLPLTRSNTAATEIVLEASYQGCAEIGVCYPPQRREFTLALPGISEAAAAETAPAEVTPAATPATAESSIPLSEVDQITATLAGGSSLLVIGLFFVMGLGLAFTPCIFPMIPILSGIIAGHGGTITTRKAFTLSLVYVLAMALTYTLAGVLAIAST
ncbi:protein-disulfide reductase DsbD, partial [endosymbiont of Ridgeia piscesae]